MIEPIALLRLTGEPYEGRWYAISRAEAAVGFSASMVIYTKQPSAQDVELIEPTLAATGGRSFLMEDLLRAAELPTPKAPR